MNPPHPPQLALVLHTHMPYVEGFGTWPHGEEWLFEAMATSYLPLTEALGDDAPVTLTLTPVLADQLQSPGVMDRFPRFLRGVRRETHRLDAAEARTHGDAAVASELERAAGQYEAALARFEALGGDVLAALAPHARWTSSATHAVLPLVASDAGVRLQVRTGIEAHRERLGGWDGGFWLPECAHAPWLDELLAAEGVRAVCVDLSALDGVDPLTPLSSPAGVTLVPLDRDVIDLVWGDAGYPSGAAYRDSHARTSHWHHPWANDGAVYDPERARRQARFDAADFVERVHDRVAGGGLCVCALDTELLGHWWHEGVEWLRCVLEEAPARGLRLVALDEALERREPAPLERELPTTSWGEGRDLRTWDAPGVADFAWRARRAELDVLAAGREAPLRAVRELLALQSSDWAFHVSRDYAGLYGDARSRGHAEAVAAALAGDQRLGGELRDLAPFASVAALLEP